jgi:ribonuclease HII
MKRIAKKYSQYGFEKHKGYWTKAHYAAIKRYGMSPEHRETYIH